MFKYYLKLALRNLQGNKLTKSVKIIGMALAIAVSMIIFLFVNHEQNYDRFFTNHQNVYRLLIFENYTDGSQVLTNKAVPVFGTEELKQNFAEIQHITKVRKEADPTYFYNNEVYEFNDSYNVDSTFFKIFNVKLLLGDRGNVLNQPGSAVISSNVAKKIFGNKNPIGETIIEYNRNPFIITGVFEDFPSSSHILPDIIKSFKKGHNVYRDVGRNQQTINYVLLREGVNIVQLEESINKESTSWFASREDIVSVKNILQPVTEIHTQKYEINEQVPGISKELLRLLVLVALFILLVAWLNHLNISTNQRLKQIKQNSVDRVFGMGHKQNFYKIFVENLSDFVFSCLIAAFLITLFLPVINALLEKQIDMFSVPRIWGLFIAGILSLSLLSALIEMLLISKVSFINSLKGQLGGKKSGKWMKKSVLVAQYAISVVLIFFTAIVFVQSKYLINRDIGMEKDNIIIFSTRHKQFTTQEEINKKIIFTEENKKNSGLKSATFCSSIPGSITDYQSISRTDEPDKIVLMQTIATDENYLKTFQIELIAGENLRRKLPQDQYEILIDRTSSKLFGFETPTDAIGNSIFYYQWNTQMKIVGIIEDFNTHNLGYMGQETGNFLGYHMNYNRRYLAVNYGGTNPQQVINKIQDKWKEVFNEAPPMYYFLNDSYRKVYKSELVQRKLFLLFAFTAIIIACFGLFAMAFETIVQRTKEIGVRKVNGAKIIDILNLLFSDYIRIIIIAVVPGLLIGYFISSNWLKEYAIKISISWYFFILPFVVLGCITLVSVMYHSYKAAVSNPIEALKYE